MAAVARIGLVLAVVLGAGCGAMAAPASGPTMEEILRQAQSQGPRAPQKAAPPAPLATAPGPTMGEILKQQNQGRPTPSPSVPAQPLPTMGDIVSQAQADAKKARADTPGCTRPKPPGAMPDGAKATDEDIRKAQQAVKAYVRDSEAFNTCLDRLVFLSKNELTFGDYLALLNQYDLTIVAMQTMAERFNQQLRIYKARPKP
jgi:hypothetical protein